MEKKLLENKVYILDLKFCFTLIISSCILRVINTTNDKFMEKWCWELLYWTTREILFINFVYFNNKKQINKDLLMKYRDKLAYEIVSSTIWKSYIILLYFIGVYICYSAFNFDSNRFYRSSSKQDTWYVVLFYNTIYKISICNYFIITLIRFTEYFLRIIFILFTYNRTKRFVLQYGQTV